MEYLSHCDLCDGQDFTRYPENNICVCKACGYTFCNPRPILNEIVNFYSDSQKYDSWLKEETGRDALWQKRLAMVTRYKRRGAILDVGAGVSQFLFFARRDFEVFGTEISESAIKISMEKYNVSLREGILENIDFGDQRFDVITLFHVLEHVPSPSFVIEKCYNLLNEDGVLVIAVPNEINSPVSFMKRCAKYLISLLSMHNKVQFGVYGLPAIKLDGSLKEIHLSYFTVSSLKKLLLKKRFTIIEDTLDPFYPTSGIIRHVDNSIYFLFLMLKKIFKVNIYETMWIAAKRKEG